MAVFANASQAPSIVPLLACERFGGRQQPIPYRGSTKSRRAIKPSKIRDVNFIMRGDSYLQCAYPESLLTRHRVILLGDCLTTDKFSIVRNRQRPTG
jgi:hypothetical protein